MVENFKLTAVELKRQLKISIYLPDGYNESTASYPLLYVTDGQLMFHSLDDNKKEFDLPSILDSCQKKCICVGIHAPTNNLWRESELCTYYKKDETEIDPNLSINFAEYLVNKLHPIILERYRITEDVFLLGFASGAIFNLYSVYKYDLFKGAGIFSPTIDKCDGLFEALNSSFDSTKAIYLYYGGDSNLDLYSKLYNMLEELKCQKLLLDYESEEDNAIYSWPNHIISFINFILP